MRKGMVFGAGISGLGAKRLLEKMGYEVILVDDKVAISSKEAMELFDGVSIFVKSPGVPYTELVEKAKELNIEIVDEIEIAYRYKVENNIPGKIIGITGTNGKTTVTTKIMELINYSGMKSKECGNIGVSFAETVLDRDDLDYFVLELSSYQLENIERFRADIGMVINLAPDHLNRYRDEEHYYDTKLNISKNQTEEDIFIMNISCEEIKKREKMINGKICKVGLKKIEKDQKAYVENGYLIYNNERVLDINLVSLKGKHNLENMLFIVSVGKSIGIENEKIREFLYNTKSLEHRMENFFNYNEIIFINDSKGTNIESTKFAIEAYDKPILICGGVDKKLDLSPLAKLIEEKVYEIYLIGEIANKLENELIKAGFSKEKIYNLGDLEKVILKLKENLNGNEKRVVLFSPTTASFDQFKNFEVRGQVFKELILKHFK